MPLVCPSCLPNAVDRATVPSRGGGWMRLSLVVLAAACSGGSDGGTSPTPRPTGTITVNLTPSSVTIAPGGTGSVGLNVTRGGAFDGAVSLRASGVPAGVTLSFGSSSVAAVAVSTSVNLTVAAGVPAGTTEISIIGTGTGAVSPPSRLTLRVP